MSHGPIGPIGLPDGFDVDIWKMRKIKMISDFFIWGTKMVEKAFMKKTKGEADLVIVWIKNSVSAELNLKF